MAGSQAPNVTLTASDRGDLERWARRRKTAQGLALRARIVLCAAKGMSNIEIADTLNTSRITVGKWRRRFIELGPDGLLDEPRPGAPRKIEDAKIEEVIQKTLEKKPRAATHWSTRLMAEETGLSATTVRRIWRAFGLQPHRSETFSLSNDPLFIEKVRDIVGLYMAPPDNAVVLCVDEKSQIQALDRSQPLLPMIPGQAERRTHTYSRHGTTTLFAALNHKTGEVIGQCRQRHTAKDFRDFLRTIDKAVPRELDIHVIMDNLSTHKGPTVTKWFASHPRFHPHFTPTYSSWLNLVERWFGLLEQRKIKRGSHRSTRALRKAIREYLDYTNENPRPFVWTKTADQILENLAGYCERISGAGH